MSAERKTNGAERLCDTLIAQGVDTCFANPGTSEMHFVGALDRRPEMRCVLGLFEGVVTGAADGYARMAEKPAATLLHLGPGLANGLANLHNAKRARTPLINVVGDHATHHLRHEAPLASDIDGLARPMSNWLGRATRPDEVGPLAAAAWRAAVSTPGVATLVLPGDAAWNAAAPVPIVPLARDAPKAVDAAKIRAIARAVATGGRTVFLVGGRALRADVLPLVAAIAERTGAEFVAETFNARIERGTGRIAIGKLPYGVDDAVRHLAGAKRVVLIDARPPVGFFAYPGKPSELQDPAASLYRLVEPDEDLAEALALLAEGVGAEHRPRTATAPGPAPAPGFRPDDLPKGPLTAQSTCAIVAALLPEEAIVCDESISAGATFFETSYGGARHDYLQITGGSIGIGLPLGTGAAVACPGRRVVCLQADGSAMYTIQALWTQARERLDVTTVILSNRRYAILEHEMRNVGILQYGENARRMLRFDDPPLDWVALAGGHGVEAARAETGEALADLLRAANARKGPFLIEAAI
ncbi:acetolactate synthase large subunit [Jiella sonneratiae]|uniref:Acetolactate synthase large subunit n=1 Tax=Jiella sonneratiae TaxID=2816856 RepID=A0ABS3IYJ3_9HYPH|nr:acetolactate synthase large subunit [Jiella sonneratiae]MBO0902472.1 acetolactate synthase large subunit [Jiella sonneratiae]